MPNDFFVMFYVMFCVYTTSHFNKVLKPEDSCPGGSQKFSKGYDSSEHFWEINFHIFSFLLFFSKIAFPADQLHQFSFRTFPVKTALLTLSKRKDLPLAFLNLLRYLLLGRETLGASDKWTIQNVTVWEAP